MENDSEPSDGWSVVGKGAQCRHQDQAKRKEQAEKENQSTRGQEPKREKYGDQKNVDNQSLAHQEKPRNVPMGGDLKVDRQKGQNQTQPSKGNSKVCGVVKNDRYTLTPYEGTPLAPQSNSPSSGASHTKAHTLGKAT